MAQVSVPPDHGPGRCVLNRSGRADRVVAGVPCRATGVDCELVEGGGDEAPSAAPTAASPRSPSAYAIEDLRADPTGRQAELVKGHRGESNVHCRASQWTP
jgi:hypothetical protein